MVRRLEVTSARDDATAHVLEAVMVAMIILAAAYSVVSLRDAGPQNEKPRASLEKVTRDSLTVLAGLADANGTLLDQAWTEQYHCARDAAPSSACQGGRAPNLTEKVDNYLPAGAAYAVLLDNGIHARTIYRSNTPVGESVSATYAYVPNWNLTFAATELSCYDPGMDVVSKLLPLSHGAVANASRVNASVGAVNATATSATGGAWNATLAAATRPASGTLVANATVRNGGTHPGLTAYASCAIGAATGNATLAAWRNDSMTLPASIAIGTTGTLSADLSRIAAVAGVTLVSSNLTIYDALPPRPGEADTYVAAQVIDLPAGTAPSATWTPPDDSLLGVHPVVLRAKITIGATTLEARKVGTFSVALPGGVVPVDPPYRAVLQTWLPEWS